MKNNYKVVLEMTGIKYKAEGETIDEAIANLGLEWNQIKGKGLIKVFKDKASAEYLFYMKQLKRIFANKTTRMMWAKRLELFLKESHDNL
jgi:hypothetical protein